MDINKQQLVDETRMLGNAIYNGISRDRIAREYSTFITLNAIIRTLLGSHLNIEIILKKYPNIVKFVNNENNKSLQNFNSRVLREKDLFEEIFCNHAYIYNESDMLTYTCGGDFRRYSVSDAKDILFSYFSEYGNKVYQIVKKYSLVREYGRNGFPVEKIINSKKFDSMTANDIYRIIRIKADRINTVINAGEEAVEYRQEAV